MCHDFLGLASFWTFLFLLDRDMAEQTREKGCSCGGVLHGARYPRKPRGGPGGLPDEHRYRFSFCCARDGCRRRTTPPSVRFLGRRVYLGPLVALVTAMRQGPTPRGSRELQCLFGADRATIARWQRFWGETFPRSDFWKVARGRFAATRRIVELPLDLLAAFRSELQSWRDAVVAFARFLSPITTGKRLEATPL